MNLSKIEMETTINFNEDEKTASLFTHNKRLIKKLKGLCLKFPKQFFVEKEDLENKCASFILPKKYIRIGAPKIISDEAKEKLRSRCFERNKDK